MKAARNVRNDVQKSRPAAARNLHDRTAMAGVRLPLSLGAAIAALVISASPVWAQIPGSVRVVNGPAPIHRWFRAPANDVLIRVEVGTTLDVLDEERGWYWVIIPPNAHGTRKAGWIRVGDVGAVPARRTSAAQAGERARLAATTAPAPSAPPAEDRVAITERRDETAAGAGTAASSRVYRFDDVHFDRDRHALRQEDLTLLQATVAALKADPALAVNIEGYTCDLGSPAYNLALGARRADMVKAYLVSQGISADRLHTISLGEDHAAHDNASEDTRRLNRRVAVVPNVRP